jgi:hypothetical protein
MIVLPEKYVVHIRLGSSQTIDTPDQVLPKDEAPGPSDATPSADEGAQIDVEEPTEESKGLSESGYSADMALEDSSGMSAAVRLKLLHAACACCFAKDSCHTDVYCQQNQMLAMELIWRSTHGHSRLLMLSLAFQFQLGQRGGTAMCALAILLSCQTHVEVCCVVHIVGQVFNMTGI